MCGPLSSSEAVLQNKLTIHSLLLIISPIPLCTPSLLLTWKLWNEKSIIFGSPDISVSAPHLVSCCKWNRLLSVSLCLGLAICTCNRPTGTFSILPRGLLSQVHHFIRQDCHSWVAAGDRFAKCLVTIKHGLPFFFLLLIISHAYFQPLPTVLFGISFAFASRPLVLLKPPPAAQFRSQCLMLEISL